MPKEESAPPTYKGTGLWFSSDRISLDASQNPVLAIRSSDGSRGAIVCIEESTKEFSAKVLELIERAVTKFSLGGLEKNMLEAAITGGADGAKWKVSSLRKAVGMHFPDHKEYDLDGMFYRKVYFEPKTGMLSVFRAEANPSDWNPASATLTLDSGTKGFSDGQVGGVVANATRFFREEVTFKALRELILPEHLQHNPNSPFTLWSAACSSGIETYSYAMYIHRLLQRAGARCPFKVYGTDINKKLVASASKGEYEISKRDLERYRAYFERYGKLDGERLRFGDEIKSFVSFGYFDLKKRPRRKGFNMIVCANVFQYYEDSARLHFLDNFAGAVGKPGYLFVGPLSKGLFKASNLTRVQKYKMFCVE